MGRTAVFGVITVALLGIAACSREAEDTAAEPANEPAASAVGDTAVPAPEAVPEAALADPAAPVAPAPEGGLIDDNE